MAHSDNTPEEINKDSDRNILAPGVILDNRYEIKAFLRADESKRIYDAFDCRFEKRPCTVKEILYTSDTPSAQSIIDRLKKEATELSKLRHPGLPVMLDYFVEKDRCYFVMDYVEGTDLEKLIEKKEPISEAKIIEWTKQLLDALEYLHSQSLIYCDLSPSNILICDEGRKVMLMDFGINKDSSSEAFRKRFVKSIFISEEVMEGNADVRSDIYSLGVTVYYLLAGSIPEASDKFRPLSEVNSKVSKEFESIVMKSLCSASSERYGSAGEMREEIENIGKSKVNENKYGKQEIKSSLKESSETDSSGSSVGMSVKDMGNLVTGIFKSRFLSITIKVAIHTFITTIIITYIFWIIVIPIKFFENFIFYSCSFFDRFSYYFFTYYYQYDTDFYFNKFSLIPLLSFLSVLCFILYKELDRGEKKIIWERCILRLIVKNSFILPVIIISVLYFAILSYYVDWSMGYWYWSYDDILLFSISFIFLLFIFNGFLTVYIPFKISIKYLFIIVKLIIPFAKGAIAYLALIIFIKCIADKLTREKFEFHYIPFLFTLLLYFFWTFIVTLNKYVDCDTRKAMGKKFY